MMKILFSEKACKVINKVGIIKDTAIYKWRKAKSTCISNPELLRMRFREGSDDFRPDPVPTLPVHLRSYEFYYVT